MVCAASERGQAAARSEETSAEPGSGCAEELDIEYSSGFSGLIRVWAGSVDDKSCVAACAAGAPAVDTSTLAPPPWSDGWGAWLALGARRGSAENSRICSAVSVPEPCRSSDPHPRPRPHESGSQQASRADNKYPLSDSLSLSCRHT